MNKVRPIAWLSAAVLGLVGFMRQHPYGVAYRAAAITKSDARKPRSKLRGQTARIKREAIKRRNIAKRLSNRTRRTH
jgi:hypothetical protein